MTRGSAHLACAGMLAIDLAARTARLWLLLFGLRCRASASVVAGAIGASDGAAAVTPMRIAGGPVQVATLARAGIPLARATSALGLEAVATYPAAIVVGAWLTAQNGASWRRALAPLVAHLDARLASVGAALVALTALVLWTAHRMRHRLPEMPGLRAELALLARLPARIAIAAIVLGAVHVLARIAVLPILTRTLPNPPPIGVVAVGSFALIYGQLVMPTPSGLGVADYLGAHGAVGALGPHAAWVLGWWRVYTTFGGLLAMLPLVARTMSRRRRSRGRS